MQSVWAHVSSVHLKRLMGVSTVRLGKVCFTSCLFSQSWTTSQSNTGFRENQLSFSSFFLKRRSQILSRCGRFVIFQVICARAPLTEQMIKRGVSILEVSNMAIGARSSGQDKGRKPWSG